MSAPSCFVPLRGGAVEVEFLAEATGGACWWFVSDPGLRLTPDELMQIQAVVDAELKHRQQAWRYLADTKRKIRVVTGSGYGGDAA